MSIEQTAAFEQWLYSDERRAMWSCISVEYKVAFQVWEELQAELLKKDEKLARLKLELGFASISTHEVCDKLTECEHQRDRLQSCQEILVVAAQAMLDAEWMVTHDWGGDRNAVRENLSVAISNCKPLPLPGEPT